MNYEYISYGKLLDDVAKLLANNMDSLVGIVSDNVSDNIKNKIHEFDEIKKEVERLREEVNELKPYKERCADIDREIERRVAISTADYKMSTLSNIMDKFPQNAYTVLAKVIYAHNKCDKCDENRIIHFKSPSGKEMKEQCKCSLLRYNYFVMPVELYSLHNVASCREDCYNAFYMNSIGRDKQLYLYRANFVDDLSPSNIVYERIVSPLFKERENAVNFLTYMNELDEDYLNMVDDVNNDGISIDEYEDGYGDINYNFYF